MEAGFFLYIYTRGRNAAERESPMILSLLLAGSLPLVDADFADRRVVGERASVQDGSCERAR